MDYTDDPNRAPHLRASEANPLDRAHTDNGDQRATRDPPIAPVAPPTLGLPKAGGALHALGEKFHAGGPTGTGALRVPLGVSPCRGVEPNLALAYDSAQDLVPPLENAGPITRTVLTPTTSAQYRFGTFDHPYVCQMLRQVNRFGIPGLVRYQVGA